MILVAASSTATSALLSQTFAFAKSSTTRFAVSRSASFSTASAKARVEPKNSGPLSSYTATSAVSSGSRSTRLSASTRLALFHAKPSADTTTPAKTATARLVSTVTTVTSATTLASVLGIFDACENDDQSKISTTRHSIVPTSAAIGTRSMIDAPNVT